MPRRITSANITRLLGPDVRFGCLQNRMVIDAHWLDVNLPNHHSLALRQAVKLLELEAAQVHQKMDLIQAVERAIARDLTEGSHIEKIAGDLNMSSRTLRRRLTEHALTFETLLEQVRQARTMSLLANPDMSDRADHRRSRLQRCAQFSPGVQALDGHEPERVAQRKPA